MATATEETVAERNTLISQLESMENAELVEVMREVKKRKRSDDSDEPDNRRGYATQLLPVVSADDERYWSVADASRLLGPPDLTEAQVRQLVHLFGFQPTGKRSGGSRRRHV